MHLHLPEKECCLLENENAIRLCLHSFEICLGGMGRAMSNGNILLTHKILIILRSLINKGSVLFSGIDVELARSIEERIMLEDAQSWVNGRTINEIKDIRSGKLLMLFN